MPTSYAFIFNRTSIFWDSSLKVNWSFGGMCHLHIQGRRNKHEVVSKPNLLLDHEYGASMFLWNTGQLSTDYTLLYPRGYALHGHSCENLKAYINVCSSVTLYFPFSINLPAGYIIQQNVFWVLSYNDCTWGCNKPDTHITHCNAQTDNKGGIVQRAAVITGWHLLWLDCTHLHKQKHYTQLVRHFQKV